MKELIDVFRMNELSIETRMKVIKRLGEAWSRINGSNDIRPIMEELLAVLSEQLASKKERYSVVSDLSEFTVFDGETGMDLYPTSTGNRKNHFGMRREVAEMIANSLNHREYRARVATSQKGADSE